MFCIVRYNRAVKNSVNGSEGHDIVGITVKCNPSEWKGTAMLVRLCFGNKRI